MHITPSQDFFDIEVNLFNPYTGGDTIANQMFRRFQPRVICFFQVIHILGYFAKPFPLFWAVPSNAGYYLRFVKGLFHIK